MSMERGAWRVGGPNNNLEENPPIHHITHSLSTDRFCEALRIAQDNLDCQNFYAFNPNFDQAQAAQVIADK
ncbi:MAG: hypothetical protein FWE19_04585 [Oscillospiraceae bacterium]|nr:hypothetical protein [Oscillospiraceae bacterium]